jgi:hypothetical protein
MKLRESLVKLFGGVTRTEITQFQEELVIKQQTESGTNRVGFRSNYASFNLEDTAIGPDHARGLKRLPFDTLRRMYRQSSAVRASVDAVVREVSNLNWVVRRKEGHEVNESHINEVKAFFVDPNVDKESVRQIISKVLTDILVLDAGVIEKVWSLSGNKLLEIVVRDAAEFVPKVDKHGVLLGYQQKSENFIFDPVDFDSDDISYMMLYPQSNSIFGQPILESIVDEVATLLHAVNFVGSYFTEDEIPPGILNLGHIGETAFNRFKRDMRARRGKPKERTVRSIYGTDKVQWVEFRRPNREMQTVEIMSRVERIIYRNFGVTPVEMGITEKVPRASAEVQLKVSRSKMLLPLVNLLNFFVNQDIVSAFGFDDVEFALVVDGFEDEALFAKAASDYVESGILTRDEARKRYIGVGPHSDGLGSIPTVTQGGSVVPLNSLNAPVLPAPQPTKENKTPEEKAFDDVGTKERKKSNIEINKLDKLMEEYEETLLDKWDTIKEEAIKKAEEEETNNKTIKTLSNLLFLRLKNSSKKFYPKALDLGIEAGETLIGKKNTISQTKRKEILEEMYELNEGFLQENLVKDLKGKYTEATKEEDVSKAIGVAFGALSFRLAGYSGSLNGVAHTGLSKVTGKEDLNIEWNDRQDEAECPDCLEMKDNSPYSSYEEMKFLPGLGTVCSGRCRCFLSVVRS